MGIIEKHMGCPGPGKAGECYGPAGPYYTVFGTELWALKTHLIVSVIIGLSFFCVLLFLKKKNKINLSIYLLILIPIVSSILLFFVFAYFFPIRIIY